MFRFIYWTLVTWKCIVTFLYWASFWPLMEYFICILFLFILWTWWVNASQVWCLASCLSFHLEWFLSMLLERAQLKHSGNIGKLWSHCWHGLWCCPPSLLKIWSSTDMQRTLVRHQTWWIERPALSICRVECFTRVVTLTLWKMRPLAAHPETALQRVCLKHF